MSSSPTTVSYWCYRCLRIVSSPSQFNDDENTTCPHCDDGFIEQIETEATAAAAATTTTTRSSSHDHHHHLSGPLSSSVMFSQDSGQRTTSGFWRRRNRRISNNNQQLTFFNPIVVLRSNRNNNSGNSNSFDLYYDDGSESGLRPIPEHVLGFLMGSGFHLLLHQLSHIDLSGLYRPENSPASKAWIESMPSIEISPIHVSSERHCAICIEPFELGNEARELPCKHLYHSDCITPWLKTRNSCPVCRHELPAEENENQENTMGLSIWWLPGGGFAVGRYNGRRVANGQRGLQIEFSEMENESRVSRRRVRVFRRVFRGFGSFFRRFRGTNNGSSSISRSNYGTDDHSDRSTVV